MLNTIVNQAIEVARNSNTAIMFKSVRGSIITYYFDTPEHTVTIKLYGTPEGTAFYQTIDPDTLIDLTKKSESYRISITN